LSFNHPEQTVEKQFSGAMVRGSYPLIHVMGSPTDYCVSTPQEMVRLDKGCSNNRKSRVGTLERGLAARFFF